MVTLNEDHSIFEGAVVVVDEFVCLFFVFAETYEATARDFVVSFLFLFEVAESHHVLYLVGVEEGTELLQVFVLGEVLVLLFADEEVVL